MSVSVRDIRQMELANTWLNNGRYGIIYAAPRTGKCRTAIQILQKEKYKTILIAYPDNKIKASWKAEFEIMGYDDCDVVYTTHLSLHKWIEKFDLVIIDEIHLLSAAQIDVCKELLKENKQCLGLTGTLSSATKNTLYNELKLPVLATYSIEQAIEEGVIADYEITVIKVPLDRMMKTYKGKSEKQQFDNLTWVIDKMEREGKATFFLRLKRMRIIQNSTSKLAMTKLLLHQYKNERILVFCGTTKIADSLGIRSYHSKSIKKNDFQDFVKGRFNHLAVCKIGNTGITFMPLSRVIINSFDSNPELLTQRINRSMSFEYNNPEKKALIYIITSTEPTELKWLSKALIMFDKSKIKYL